MAPNMLPLSVKANAGISYSLAFFAKALSLQEASNNEYSECVCKWTNDIIYSHSIVAGGFEVIS